MLFKKSHSTYSFVYNEARSSSVSFVSKFLEQSLHNAVLCILNADPPQILANIFFL